MNLARSELDGMLRSLLANCWIADETGAFLSSYPQAGQTATNEPRGSPQLGHLCVSMDARPDCFESSVTTAGATDAPHDEQNRASSNSGLPHLEQYDMSISPEKEGLSPSSSGYFFFSASRRIAPIVLSLRVFLPSGFLIVPGGSPCFFSKAPTVLSLRVFLNIVLLSFSEGAA